MRRVKATAAGLEYCQSMTTAKAEHDAKQTPFRPITDQLKTQLPKLMKTCIKCGEQLLPNLRSGGTLGCKTCMATASMAARGKAEVEVRKMEVSCFINGITRNLNNINGISGKLRLRQAVDLIAKMKAGT